MLIEYKMIKGFYEDRRAKRSGVLLMNHIDEGLEILESIAASDYAKKAYCIHPLLQTDEALALNFNMCTKLCSPRTIALAMEYRNQANAWLSDKVQKGELIGYPTPGPIPEVRDMLYADKVQNYKDFVTYHKDTHPRTYDLDLYFRMWLRVLKV